MFDPLRLTFALLPVVLFLLALVSLDSYKLVRLTAVLKTLLIGGIVAGLAYILNRGLSPFFGESNVVYSRYVAPVIEETLKALYIIYLLRAHKVGFLVDAAIYGFAVGAGFAVVENIYYLGALGEANLLLWLIRGCGTAVMHGGATAIFAILAKTLAERYRHPLLALAPGLLTAIFIHSLFNHFFVPPVFTTLAQLVTLPLFMAIIFSRSEHSLRHWLELGMDSDVNLLDNIMSGTISETKTGQYLLSLQNKFAGEIVADMLCFLRLHLELAIRAKGILLLRNAGFRPELEPEIREKLTELKFLEKNIGATGKLALSPILQTSTRDLWQLYVVQEL